MNILIDGDILLFRAAAAVEREVRWDDVNHVLYSNADEVWSAINTQIKGYREALGDHPMHFALTGSQNFRRNLWDGYKGGRSRKPLCYGAVRERLISEMNARFVDCLEADDLLGIWATQGKLKDPVIVSLDKDLRTVPGTLWRPPANRDQEPVIREISEAEADYFWMMQTLTGDVTDGYTGLPGCGPKTAEKVLGSGETTIGELWARVTKAYEAKGLSEDDALLQARLSRILRASDWDSTKKEVKLWKP